MSDVAQRRRAIAIAGHSSSVGFDLAGALSDPDAECRTLALGALRRRGELTSGHVAGALVDHDVMVRRKAVTLAVDFADVPIGYLLDDPEPSIAETTAWALGERETVSDDDLERLIHHANQHDNALVREAAVAALGAIGDERGLASILAACNDKPAIRRRAALALAPFAGHHVITALRHALHDRDWQVRQAAEDVLRAAGQTI